MDANFHMNLALPRHLFVELTGLDELSFATTSSRVKYTCVHSTKKYLGVGTNTGSIHLFSRFVSKYRRSISSVPLQVLSYKEGSISRVRISPNERYIAVAAENGSVAILSLADGSDNCGHVVQQSQLHADSSHVTSLTWSDDSCRVFIGDVNGRCSVLKATQSKTKAVFKPPCELLATVDSAIVQLDYCKARLLISSMTRCYVYNCVTRNYWQIGKKLRNGSYGAVFLCSSNNDGNVSVNPASKTSSGPSGYSPAIVCGRPGGRLWECNFDGVVYATHQFNGLAPEQVPCMSLISYRHNLSTSGLPVPVFHFRDILVIGESLLICVDGSKLFVIDAQRAHVVVYCELETEVADFSVCERDVFILTPDGGLRKISLLSVDKAASKLRVRGHFERCMQLIRLYHTEAGKCAWPAGVLEDCDRWARSREGPTDLHVTDPDLCRLISRLALLAQGTADSFNENHKNATSETNGQLASRPAHSPFVQQLSTGIHRVLRNPMECSGYEDDFQWPLLQGSALKFRSKSSPSFQRQMGRLSRLDDSGGPANDVDPGTPICGTVVGGGSTKSLHSEKNRSRDAKNEVLGDLSSGPSTHEETNTRGLRSTTGRSGGCRYSPSNNMLTSGSEHSLLEILSMGFSRPGAGGNGPVSKEPSPIVDDVFESSVGGMMMGSRTGKKSPIIGCNLCGLHWTWNFALTGGSNFCPAVLNESDFWEGGVPTSPSQWKDLLVVRDFLIAEITESQCTALCGKCLDLFDSWLRHQPSLELAAAGKRRARAPPAPKSAHKTRTVGDCEDFAEFLLSSTDPKPPLDDARSPPPPLSTTSKPSSSSGNKENEESMSENAAMLLSMYFNPAYDPAVSTDCMTFDSSSTDDTPDGTGARQTELMLTPEEIRSRWVWLPNVPITVLLSVMGRVVGPGPVVSWLLANNPPWPGGHFWSHLAQEYYVRMGRRRRVVNLEDLETDVNRACKNPIDVASRLRGRLPLIVSADAECPVCHVPFKSGSDTMLLLHSCGAAFHEACFDVASGCAACQGCVPSAV